MVLQHFNFIDVRSLQSVRMSLKFKSASCSRQSSNVSAQFGASASKTFFSEGSSQIVSSSLSSSYPTLDFLWQFSDV